MAHDCKHFRVVTHGAKTQKETCDERRRQARFSRYPACSCGAVRRSRGGEQHHEDDTDGRQHEAESNNQLVARTQRRAAHPGDHEVACDATERHAHAAQSDRSFAEVTEGQRVADTHRKDVGQRHRHAGKNGYHENRHHIEGHGEAAGTDEGRLVGRARAGWRTRLRIGRNSTARTSTRNSGLFMTLVSASAIFGYILSFWFLHGQRSITRSTRRLLFVIFACLCCAGAVVLLLLPSSRGRTLLCRFCRPEEPPAVTATAEERISLTSQEEHRERPISADSEPGAPASASTSHKAIFVRTCRLAVTLNMVPIFVMAIFSGVSMALSNVFPVCVGNTLAFGDFAKAAVTLCGVCMTVGCIAGNLMITGVGRSPLRSRHELVVAFGFVLTAICAILMMLFTPPRAPYGPTAASGIAAEPSLPAAFVASFLLGFGAMCYDTEVLAVVCHFFKADAGAAFSLFKSAQSVMGAAAFLYSYEICLLWQLLIFGIASIAALVSFVLLKRRLNARTTEVEEDSLD